MASRKKPVHLALGAEGSLGFSKQGPAFSSVATGNMGHLLNAHQPDIVSLDRERVESLLSLARLSERQQKPGISLPVSALLAKLAKKEAAVASANLSSSFLVKAPRKKSRA
ncbi:hypothetical protein FJZ26_05405 [Candidatus Parvarchaeota archaeon]|nr:hypothetical protein [Candidatus Parvarchaeota archaeon]